MIAHDWQVCGTFSCVIDWMYYWQTMLTGIAAVLAAGASILFLHKQIASGEAQENRRRARRLAAARAQMPLSLSDVSNYAREMIEFLKECLDGIAANQEIPAPVLALPRPALPEQAILSFVNLIEATDDDQFAALISRMIGEMQVLNSRVRGIVPDGPGSSRSNIESYILNAAKVHAYASSMFDYARNDAKIPPHSLDWRTVFSALPLYEFYDHQYPDLFALFEKARDRLLPTMQTWRNLKAKHAAKNSND